MVLKFPTAARCSVAPPPPRGLEHVAHVDLGRGRRLKVRVDKLGADGGGGSSAGGGIQKCIHQNHYGPGENTLSSRVELIA